MVRRLSFDKLPEAMQKFMEILTPEDSESSLLPELLQRLTRLESKIDHLQRTISPDRPVMEMHEVCRALRLRPRAVNELAISGVLPTRELGKKTVFFEDGVIKYFMTQGHWRDSAASKQVAVKRDPTDISPAEAREAVPVVEERRRVGIDMACEITDRKAPAIYQLISTKSIPCHKDGRKVYFFTDELREWVKNHPPKKRKPKAE